MNNVNRLMTRMAILAIAFFSLVSCDDDFNEVGGSLVDNEDFNALLYEHTALDAHSDKIDRVQSNGLSSYALGVYNDPKYGQVTANILTQLKLSQEDPSFGANPQLDSVVLTVPYFSRIKRQTAYSKEYILDSVFGDTPIQLSIYRSDYFLRKSDPNDNYNPQAYYSDQGPLFEQNIETTPLYSNNSFKPSPDQVILTEPVIGEEGDAEDTTKLSPRMRIRLSVDEFQHAIIDNDGTDKLVNNDNFQDFFRGLYFKASTNALHGVFSLLNFASDDAGVILYYRNDNDNVEGVPYNHKTYKLKFGNQIVNVFDDAYDQLPAADNNLYVKGGQGSMAVIDLFTDHAQLDSLRETDWLINEANLKFYVNKDELPPNQKNPERLFIYDIKNKMVLKDYELDFGAKENDVLNSRTIHLGRLEKDDNGNPYYKIRITNYVNDIINNDSTNTKLGLVVSQNVNIKTQSKVEVTNDDDITTVPTCEVLARNGTVFYGPEASSDKALKLEIYYTEPQ